MTDTLTNPENVTASPERGDAITATASPRPWQVRYGDTVADASGAKVAACWRPDNAALIVAAVNERDRLRDIVRRLANMAETTIPDAMENWCGFTSGRVEFEREAYALIREARAAIGEDEK